MRQFKKPLKRTFALGALGLATALLAGSAHAQYYCPAGYYYLDGYGCAPLGYYSAPSVIVPGFGFYYGGGWGHGWHGGGGHGGGGHGGGWHGGGGHGGGGHGGGGGGHHH
ncbi:MAG TPA: hypothetical protein VMI30_11715 [Stellaceae bacterium]|nr:hypothetical protein [Stellaceae bacterium]